MTKLLIIIAAVVAIVWLLRRAFAKPPAGASDAPQAGPAREGDLVSCAHCGVNLPRAEARIAGGRDYCGEEHARLGPRKP